MRTGRVRARPLALVCLAATLLQAEVRIDGRVKDENGVAVAGARIELRGGGRPQAANSDKAGIFAFTLPEPGEYEVRAERQGFFLFTGTITLREGSNDLAITINHLQEFAESIDVKYSPPAIDLQEPSDRKQLNSVEVIQVPYPAPHDLRNALPLLPNVVQDHEGRLHFSGGSTGQTNFQLDGFNLSDPVTGRFDARVNIDSVRTLELETGRFSAEKGRGSAGTLDIKTNRGDDRWRFGATNFFPGVSTQNGLHVNKWTPRATVSGPIARGRAWFHNGFDLFYDKDVVEGLPAGQNETRGATASNLTRLQVNLTPANILTGGFLANYVDAARHGLSFLDPVETTINQRQSFYMTTLKEQIYFGGGALLEAGFADSRSVNRQSPQGTETFQITPFGRRGNYFMDLNRHTNRQQWLANFWLPAFERRGAHQLKYGIDVQRSEFHETHARHDYVVLRNDLTVVRRVSFQGNPEVSRRNFEISQYLQDRWQIRDNLTIEAGLRNDWDQIVREVLWSPRLSAAWAPKGMRDTKFAAGYGVFHDTLSFGMISRHLDQVSYTTFFDPTGRVRNGPIPSSFYVDEGALRAPRYRTASVSAERKLPFEFYGKAALTRRSGGRGLAYTRDLAQGEIHRLQNIRRDRYDAFEVSLRRTFGGHFEWFGGYIRSSARTNAVVDYTVENPLFSPQQGGAFSWDAPHRFLTWGWAPVDHRLVPRRLRFLVGETNIAYLAEYRTGYPFSAVSEDGYIVGRPQSWRFPSYFNINLHFERRFRLLHYLWAWRFGFNNLTNNGNSNVVNNNADSPAFLAYGRGQPRAFSVRLRFLGKR